MFRVIVDGKEIGAYKSIAYAKKQADLYLELGGYFGEIYRCKKPYCCRFYHSKWKYQNPLMSL